jgi:hypothetical protein
MKGQTWMDEGDDVIEVDVIEERPSSSDVMPAGGAGGGPGVDVERRYKEAEAEISAWLDEAVDEGAAIVERAREEGERLRLEAAEQAERLRLTAERAVAEARRNREQLLRDAEADSARARADASNRMAAALREAEEQASRRRRAAAEEAAILLAESRAAAERKMEDANWRVRQAVADAEVVETRAAATVAGLQADVGLLQQQLTGLVEHAMTLLPALDTAARSLARGGQPEASVEDGAEDGAEGLETASPALDEGVAELEAGMQPPPEEIVAAGPRGLGHLQRHREDEPDLSGAGLGHLAPRLEAVDDDAGAGDGDGDMEQEAAELDTEAVAASSADETGRRRPLGRLLGRR